jgi:hypothetical protein
MATGSCIIKENINAITINVKIKLTVGKITVGNECQ